MKLRAGLETWLVNIGVALTALRTHLMRSILTTLGVMIGVFAVTLAVAVGEESSTVEEVCEPFLVRVGMLARTRQGRIATPAAWAHLGLKMGGPAPPTAGDTLFDG